MPPKALIHELFAKPLDGAAIEALSLAAIDREAPPHPFTAGQWEVARRVIHTTADFALLSALRFSPGAVAAGIAALSAGRPLYTDSNMIRAGISQNRLQTVCPAYGPSSIHCHVADPDISREARQAGLPRSIFAVRKAKTILDGGIALFGNAPAALLELNRLILEEKVRPALVIAASVGFIHVEESKNELMGLDVPYIALTGRRGGSPIAVAVLHALCTLATRSRPARETQKQNVSDFDTVILLGHGSRVPGAAQSMELVAKALAAKNPGLHIATCQMSRLGPHFAEVFEACVRRGSRRVLLLPYFLHEGLHIKLDIPTMMKKAAEVYPQVRLVLGKNLGFDPLLVELTEKRMAESRGLADVRDLVLPDEETYPVPPGQPEFVPMPPAQAAQWKKTQGRSEE